MDAWNKEGASVMMPPDYVKCEVLEGAIAPIGRFRSPLQTQTNASTLHLYGPGLSSFADWQVPANIFQCNAGVVAGEHVCLHRIYDHGREFIT